MGVNRKFDCRRVWKFCWDLSNLISGGNCLFRWDCVFFRWDLVPLCKLWVSTNCNSNLTPIYDITLTGSILLFSKYFDMHKHWLGPLKAKIYLFTRAPLGKFFQGRLMKILQKQLIVFQYTNLRSYTKLFRIMCKYEIVVHIYEQRPELFFIRCY